MNFNIKSIYIVVMLLANHLTTTGSIFPFEMVNDLIVFQLELNDSASNFILDTGSEDVLLNTNKGIKEGSTVEFETLSGTISSKKLEHICLKHKAECMYHGEAYQINLEKLEEYIRLPLTGILGTSALKAYMVTIDYENQIIILNKAPKESTEINHRDHSLELRFTNGIPYVRFHSVQGPINMLLDSGASTHLISKHFIDKNTTNYSEMGTVSLINQMGDEVEARRLVLYDFKELVGKDAYFIEQNLTDILATSVRIDGILAPSRLDLSRISIDFKNNKMFFVKRANPYVTSE